MTIFNPHFCLQIAYKIEYKLWMPTPPTSAKTEIASIEVELVQNRTSNQHRALDHTANFPIVREKKIDTIEHRIQQQSRYFEGRL